MNKKKKKNNSKEEPVKLPIGSLCVIHDATGEARTNVYRVLEHFSRGKKFPHVVVKRDYYYDPNGNKITDVIPITQVISVATFNMCENRSKRIKINVSNQKLKPLDINVLRNVLNNLQNVINELMSDNVKNPSEP